jgi:hypothetical protein
MAEVAIGVRCLWSMTSTNDESKNLRTDTRGRVRVPVERQEELLNEFERSGISAMRFAKMVGVHYATFANWRQKRKKARLQVPVEGEALEGTRPAENRGVNRPVRLFEASTEFGGSGAMGVGGLVVELAAGARLVVESPGQLRLAAELIRMLGPTARRPC